MGNLPSVTATFGFFRPLFRGPPSLGFPLAFSLPEGAGASAGMMNLLHKVNRRLNISQRCLIANDDVHFSKKKNLQRKPGKSENRIDGIRGGLLGVKTPFFLAIKIRAPLKGPFRGLFGTGPTFTVRGPGNELGASKVQKRATLRPPSAC